MTILIVTAVVFGFFYLVEKAIPKTETRRYHNKNDKP
jgi:hypothetical protein